MAPDIRWTQEYLATLARDGGLPPKILIIHQWRDDMIVNHPSPARSWRSVGHKRQLMGSVDEKIADSTALVADDAVEFGGIMMSGTWDSPAITPENVINLPHAPEIVIY